MVVYLEILIIILLAIIIYQLISFFNQVSDKDLFIERLINFLKFIRLPVVLIILYALGMHINFIIAILLFIIGYRLLSFFDQPISDEDGNPIVDNGGDLVYDGISTFFGMILFIICLIAGIGFIVYSIFFCG